MWRLVCHTGSTVEKKRRRRRGETTKTSPSKTEHKNKMKKKNEKRVINSINISRYWCCKYRMKCFRLIHIDVEWGTVVTIASRVNQPHAEKSGLLIMLWMKLVQPHEQRYPVLSTLRVIFCSFTVPKARAFYVLILHCHLRGNSDLLTRVRYSSRKSSATHSR